MATLYKHGPIRGVFKRGGDRYVCFENGTVLRNRPNGCGGFAGWRLTAFNTDRLLSGTLLTPDTSAAAQAILARANRDNHVHEGAKRLRHIERRIAL
jgi:hypothetical protein